MVATSCQVRLLRLSETRVEVTLPGVLDTVALRYPTLGPVGDLLPSRWEPCSNSHSYQPPLEVSYTTGQDGTITAVATRDLANLQDHTLLSLMLSAAILFLVPAIVWAILAWWILRQPD